MIATQDIFDKVFNGFLMVSCTLVALGIVEAAVTHMTGHHLFL